MTNEAFTVIVPARLSATRLPGKPLADIGGTPMLIRVLQRAAAAGAQRVVAAVADQPLVDAVQGAGYEAVLTGEHDSGSSRVAAAADSLHLPPESIVVNVQGDEPFIEPPLIRAVAALAAKTACALATACRPIKDAEEYHNPAVVKVVGDSGNFAAYFSRAAIPHQRAGGIATMTRAHLGLYAWRLNALQHFISQPPAPTEQAEQLEQLRVLWHGGRIALLDCTSESFGIDTPSQLAHARHLVNRPPIC